MSQPTTIREIMFTDSTVVDSTRTSDLGIYTNYWVSRNLPGTGKATLDSTIGGFNCEVRQFYFGGHGSGNYVTNFKYYVTDQNAVSNDMTHMFYATDTFTNPSTYDDADIHTPSADWSVASTSVPASSNVSTYTGFSSNDDPTVTQFIYNAVVVESGKTTGTASWKSRLLYQYT